MALVDCHCALDQYFSIFTENNPNDLKSLKEIEKTKLKPVKPKGTASFSKTIRAFPITFQTSFGLPGNQLLEWKDETHQKGLIDMAHDYLCLHDYGPSYWPRQSPASDDGSLQYPRDEYEIYLYIIGFFFRLNYWKIGKRIRSTRSPRNRMAHVRTSTAQFNGGWLQSHSPVNNDRLTTSSREEETQRSSTSTPIELEPSVTSSQNSLTSQNNIQPRARDETYRVASGQGFSPDPLAGDIQQQEDFRSNKTRRHIHRFQDGRGHLKRITIGHAPQPDNLEPVAHQRLEAELNHNTLAVNSSGPTVSTGTQTTFESDETRPNRDANAPPPSSLNTNANNSSQESMDNDHRNKAHETALGRVRDSTEIRERLPRSPSEESSEEPPSPPLSRPSTASHVTKGNVDLVLSYDALPGFNLRLRPIMDIFSCSLKYLSEELCWQDNFDQLFVFLEAPGIFIVEVVFKDDEKEFQAVLTRFEQHVDALKLCYAECDRNVVIEISLEPRIEGHTRSARLNAWLNRLAKLGQI